MAFWTARTAQARGRNPWLWGGAAFVLGIPWPWPNLPILGVLPVLFLMFFVRPADTRPTEQRNACSKCASPHAPGQNFCTKCGWDLSRDYSAESPDTVLASEMHPPQSSSTATIERPQEAGSPEASTSPTGDFAHQPADTASESPQPEPEPERPLPEDVVVPGEGEQPEETAAPQESEPDGEQRPWGIPVPGPAPTAEGMTARGAALLSEGKLQEAIDQFTKAIALDPKHREAFERRAEAYSRQGRQERADEDYRQVQALNTGA